MERFNEKVCTLYAEAPTNALRLLAEKGDDPNAFDGKSVKELCYSAIQKIAETMCENRGEDHLVLAALDLLWAVQALTPQSTDSNDELMMFVGNCEEADESELQFEGGKIGF